MMMPWLTWGNLFTTAPLVLGQTSQPGGSQLVNVQYKRPENWRWFLFAMVTNATGVVAGDIVNIFWQFTFGVGRGSITIPNFEFFHITSSAFGTPFMSASINAPARDNTLVAPFPQNIIDHLPAQDFYIQPSIVFTAGNAGDTVTVQVAAFATPDTHIRPDWYLPGPESEQFAGQEVHGR